MKEEILKLAKELEEVEDVYINETEDIIHLDFNDFEGFDENYEEVDREYVFPEKVDKLYNFLKDNCKEHIMDFYQTFVFEDFNVKVGFTSFDI